MLSAYNENRGRSAPVPLNATGSFTLPPSPNAYTKPLLVLTDEFSASGGDMFPALIQDNVQPDIFQDYMTGANLLSAGRPCREAFTNAIMNLVQQAP